MPASRRTASNTLTDNPQSDDGSVKKDDSAYHLKRKRNNAAVKKARAKSKETANERKTHIEKLRRENERLEGEIKQKKENLKYLKALLLNNVRTEDQKAVIDRILNEPSDDENDSK